VEVKK